MEASALRAPAGISSKGAATGTHLLRLRSDAQLVAMFRAGHDEAFRIIHDRYRQRLFAYTRQMLAHRQDAEDALQDVFVRAYSGLRASDRDLALRAWLYRVAHNRCIDELRRPAPPSPELLELMRPPEQDPIAEADKRESLRRLIADVRRLPEQQRSALLMRELGGMTYAEIADASGVSIAAVKSLLVRARVALAEALEARDTACSEIRAQLSLARGRGVRPGAMAKRHMRDCDGCRQFHRELRLVGREFAAISPAAGPLGMLAKLLGLGGLGSGASSYAAAGGGAAVAGGAAGSGAVATGVLATGTGHVATLLAAAIVTAGGAVEIEHTFSAPVQHRHQRHQLVRPASPRQASGQATAAAVRATGGSSGAVSAAPTAPPAKDAAVSMPAHAASATANAAGVKTPAAQSAPAADVTPSKPASTAQTGTNGTSGEASAPAVSASGSQARTAGTTSGSAPAPCTAGTGGVGTTSAGTSAGTMSAGGTTGSATSATGTASAGTTAAGTSSTGGASGSATSAPGTSGVANSPASTPCVHAGAGSTTSTAASTAGTPSASSAPSDPAQITGTAGTGSAGTPTVSGSSPTGT